MVALPSQGAVSSGSSVKCKRAIILYDFIVMPLMINVVIIARPRQGELQDRPPSRGVKVTRRGADVKEGGILFKMKVSQEHQKIVHYQFKFALEKNVRSPWPPS